MDNQQIFYFGTNGSRECVPLIVYHDGDVSPLYLEHEVCEKLERTLSYMSLENVTFGRGYFLGRKWTVYLKPWSVDDYRCGCFTSLFCEGEHTIEEMESIIKRTPFLQRQFTKPIEPNSEPNRFRVVNQVWG